jgi:excisionase family DNA binding protein
MEETALPNQYLTVRKAAERLDVADNTIRNAIRSGKLKAYKILSTYRIKPEDLDSFIESCRVDDSVRATAPLVRSRAEVGRPFKHLDGRRSLAAWQRQGVAVGPPGGHSAQSSGSSYDPSAQKAS